MYWRPLNVCFNAQQWHCAPYFPLRIEDVMPNNLSWYTNVRKMYAYPMLKEGSSTPSSHAFWSSCKGSCYSSMKSSSLLPASSSSDSKTHSAAFFMSSVSPVKSSSFLGSYKYQQRNVNKIANEAAEIEMLWNPLERPKVNSTPYLCSCNSVSYTAFKLELLDYAPCSKWNAINMQMDSRQWTLQSCSM